MNTQQCLGKLRQIKDAAFATVDRQGNPRVRIIDIMLVGDDFLCFVTARGKDFYRQLKHNPNVAVTALTPEFQSIRLTGKATLLSPQKQWIDRVFQENPVMNGVYPGDSRYILEPFAVTTGTLEVFDLSSRPILRETLPLGNSAPSPKGYVISQACVSCGACKACCPQNCIVEGNPYAIQQQHCLHCGLCAETCPAEAIHRKETTL